MIYNQFDIIKIPFPFTDKDSNKVRPAVIISSPNYAINTNHYILVMITSAKQSDWVDDIIIKDLRSSGLPAPSKIRFKLFSLDERLIINKVGELGKDDQNNLIKTIYDYLNLN